MLLVIASIIGGLVFYTDSMSPANRPRICWGHGPFLLAMILALTGTVLLFCVKWYYGLCGIGGIVVGFNVCALLWSDIFEKFKL